MPSPEHEALVRALTEGNPVVAESVDEQRASYRAMLCANPIPDDVSIETIRIGQCDADWVSVPASRNDHVVLYFHGGGYVIGDNVAYREFAARVARATATRVCVLNYRLAPENPFPAAVDDAVAAYRWLLGEGVEPGRITLAGDSAGGGLTLATLVALRDANEPLPGCAVCYSPWTDLLGSGESARPGVVDDPLVAGDAIAVMAEAYAAGRLEEPLASPLNADYRGLPPLLIQVGSREILRDDSRRVADKARAAGVDVEYFEGDGLIHVWPVLAPTAPESAAALERMAAFMAQHTG